MTTMNALRTATIDARKRMDDPTLGVAVCGGQFVVQSIVPREDGSCDVENLSDFGTALDAIGFLNNL